MESSLFPPEYFMKEALKEAQRAMEKGEVPVVAVVVMDDRIIAKAHNMTQQLKDVTAHAEMLALTSASNFLGAKYLKGCTLYVSLEPCLMCASALKWAQLEKLVYAASDPREGYSHRQEPVLHPKTTVEKGIMEEEASSLLRGFFSKKRPSSTNS